MHCKNIHSYFRIKTVKFFRFSKPNGECIVFTVRCFCVLCMRTRFRVKYLIGSWVSWWILIVNWVKVGTFGRSFLKWDCLCGFSIRVKQENVDSETTELHLNTSTRCYHFVGSSECFTSLNKFYQHICIWDFVFS